MIFPSLYVLQDLMNRGSISKVQHQNEIKQLHAANIRHEKNGSRSILFVKPGQKALAEPTQYKLNLVVSAAVFDNNVHPS